MKKVYKIDTDSTLDSVQYAVDQVYDRTHQTEEDQELNPITSVTCKESERFIIATVELKELELTRNPKSLEFLLTSFFNMVSLVLEYQCDASMFQVYELSN